MKSTAKKLKSTARREKGPDSAPLTSRLVRLAVPTIVASLTFIVFLPGLWNGFVNWDDDKNFLENPRYRGLGWTQLRWMFTTFHLGPYQPLSWISLGLDYSIWGMNPFGYHLTNLILHTANAVLFYSVALYLLRLTVSHAREGNPWDFQIAAGFAALMFAIHPLRVESVAWVTERRDVLSGLFFLLTILCYLRAATEVESSRRRWIGGAVVVYALSLLSKAIGITVPVVLLVLDIYPLRRLGVGKGKWFGSEVRRIWLEKIPFLVLAVVFGIVALLAQEQAHALKPLQRYGLASRLAQALYGAAFYLWKTVIPLSVSPFYRLPVELRPLDLPYVVSGVVFLGISLVVFLVRKRCPAGLAIWIYYLVLLAPVSGIAQAGMQIAADRYSYLSCLGWALLAGAGLLFIWERRQRLLAPTLAATVTVGLGVLTWRQTQVWHDSERLWRYVLALDPQIAFAYSNLGVAVAKQGRFKEAQESYLRSLALDPKIVLAHNNLGAELARQGRLREAQESYLKALEIEPAYPEAHYNLGSLYWSQGQLEEAVHHYKEAIRLSPDFGEFADAYNNLGNVSVKQGKLKEAIQYFRHALELKPKVSYVHYNLAHALASEGQIEEAMHQYKEAVILNPNFTDAYNNMGNILIKQGRLKEAIQHFRRALELDSGSDIHYNLARALASEGQTEEAMRHLQQALTLQPDFVQAHYYLGSLLAAQGQLDEAIEHFRRALRIQPQFAEAHESLARALALQGKREEAMKHYQEALRILKSRKEARGG